MKNIERAFQNHTRIDKIRTAKFVTQTINTNNELIKTHDGSMNTVLGLLAKGDRNCAGEEMNEMGDLFNTQTKTPQQPADRRARQPHEIEQGVIRTQREKEQAEEEARKKKEEDEAKAREAEAAQKAEEERLRKENSWFNRMKRGLKKFGTDIISEEE